MELALDSVEVPYCHYCFFFFNLLLVYLAWHGHVTLWVHSSSNPMWGVKSCADCAVLDKSSCADQSHRDVLLSPSPLKLGFNGREQMRWINYQFMFADVMCWPEFSSVRFDWFKWMWFKLASFLGRGRREETTAVSRLSFLPKPGVYCENSAGRCLK